MNTGININELFLNGEYVRVLMCTSIIRDLNLTSTVECYEVNTENTRKRWGTIVPYILILILVFDFFSITTTA